MTLAEAIAVWLASELAALFAAVADWCATAAAVVTFTVAEARGEL